ncbi:trigger factor [Crateriforma spongiae]|uniref:trigger factor n=1 Tax=Crateriforma spongiae TaxID=2724528 RepID=UPI0039B0E9AA
MSTDVETAADNEKKPIQLDVSVESPQACLRQVVVKIPQSEVERYREDAFSELVPEAQVPGFRAGRAPRKLVEKQFKDRIGDQVKGALLMDSLAQVTEQQEFSAISEPDFDYESIELPDSGDFVYQFSIEVRPDFDTPKWEGLELTKPVEDVGDADIDEALERVLSRYGKSEATDEPAEMGDTLLLTATFKDGDNLLSTMDEERIKLQGTLSLSDAMAPKFGETMLGIKEGESRDVEVVLSDGLEDEDLKGKTVTATFVAVEVYKVQMPELTPSFLEELGDFESEDELRSFVKDSLTRQADYRTQQALRGEVVEKLTGSAEFELPPNLVKRQTARELERKILELRRSGFAEDDIRRFVNATRQNAQASTEAALREHFILEQIAEEQEIDADAGDFDQEVALIAQQSDQPERRVRARLEKSGQMDALRNQIVERKVIELIVEKAKVTEEKVDSPKGESDDSFAVYHSVVASADEEAIPEAQYEDNTPKGVDDSKLPDA